VHTVVGALQAALQPATERDQDGTPRVRIRARSGRWLTLHGARTLASAAHRRDTIIVIEPSRPRELAWLRASAYGLSERERAVVDLVVQGCSTKEIARALSISEYTVQEHLSHAFDKVGVRGRRALVQQLFLDNICPTLGQSSATERGGLPTSSSWSKS
jgi:DNA-binding CsgD family transcriptional regulator